MGATPRLAEDDPYRVMSKRSIFERLSAMKGTMDGISRTMLVSYCGQRMPDAPSDISDHAQDRFSRAIWQMDRGYLKVAKGSGKPTLYLTIGGQRRQDAPAEPPSPPGWYLDLNTATLMWRK